MGEILKGWIENKVGVNLEISQDHKKFRRSMSNGYVIGVILRKCSVISEEQCLSLRNTWKNKSSVKNMQQIHKWLREIGLNTEFQDLVAIVEEKPGAAIHFLYRLYLWMESPKNNMFSKSNEISSGSKMQESTGIKQEDGGCGTNLSKTNRSEMELKSKESLTETKAESVVEVSSQNSYYQVHLQPPVLLNVKPFSGDGNFHEWIDHDVLYYDFQSQGRSNEINRECGRNDSPRNICSLSRNHDKLKARAALELKRAEEIQISMNEMKKFNEIVQHSLDKQLPNVKIYENGIGDVEDYKRSLLTLKKKLRDNQQQANERVDTSKSSPKIQASMIGSQTSSIPSRKTTLLEFISSSHSNRNCFLNNEISKEKQLSRSESLQKSPETSKAISFIDQNELLQRCITQKDMEFSKCVENEIALKLVQKTAFSKKTTVDVPSIVDNALDLAIKIATFREAVKAEPPLPLVEEWKEKIYLADATQEEGEASRGEMMTILDDLRVRAYLFREAEWKVEVPNVLADFTENEILKKIVSHVLECLYPELVPSPTTPLPQLTGIVAVTGVNFHWKPALIRDTLQDIFEPYSLKLLDTTLMVQEAIKAYATAFAMSSEILMNGDPNLFLRQYDGEVEGEEFQTLWRLPTQDYPPGLISDAEETEVSDEGLPETLAGVRSVKVELPEKKEPPSANESTNIRSQRKKMKKTQTTSKKKSKSGSSKRVKISNKVSQQVIDSGVPAETMEDAETFPPSASPQFIPDDAVVTVEAVEKALEQRKNIIKPSQFNYLTEPPGTSRTYEFEGESSMHVPMADASTEAEIQFLFSPHDQPETWPELVKLGRLAWEQIWSGYPVSDSLVAKIVAERIRHYPTNSYVVILNFPQGLCQAINFEDSVNENNLPKLPCYHNADIIINELKDLPNDQVGPYLIQAGHHLTSTPKYESVLFTYQTSSKTSSDSFQSFLDAVIIADINQNQITDPMVLNNLEVAQQRIIDKPDKSIKEKLEVLNHLSYLQLKKFYTDQGLAFLLELGIFSEPYYAALKELLQQLIAKKNSQKRRFLEYLGETEIILPGEYSVEEVNVAEEEIALTQVFPSKEVIEKKESEVNTKADENSQTKAKKKSKGKDKEKAGKGKKGKSKEGKGSTKSKSRTKAKGDTEKHTKVTSPNVEMEKTSADLNVEEEVQIALPLIEVLAQPVTAPSIFYNINGEDIAVLGNFWKNLEDRYVRGVHNALREIRSHHDRVNTAVHHLRTKLANFLARPENGPSLLLQFQEKFNQACSCIQGNHDIKGQLQNRVRELQERLSAICDERHDEAILQVLSIPNDEPCLEGEIEILTNLYITLIQLEADHYCEVIQFINKFYGMSGLLNPESLPSCDILRVELISRSRFTSAQFLDGEEDDEEDILLEVISEKLSAAGLIPGQVDHATSSMRAEPSSTDSNKDAGLTPSSILSRSKKKRSKMRHVSIAYNSKRLIANDKIVPDASAESSNSPKAHPDVPIAKENPDAEPPANRVLEGYFGNDEYECEEDEIQNTFMDNVLANHEVSSVFFQSIFNRASRKINKVERFTINYVKNNVSATSLTSIAVPLETAKIEETASKIIPEPSNKDLPKITDNTEGASQSNLNGKSTKKKKKPKGEDGKNKKKSKSKESGSEGEKGKNKKKAKKKQKSRIPSVEELVAKNTVSASAENLAKKEEKLDIPKIDSAPRLSAAHHLPHTISNKENAMKRIAEWKKVIKIEGKRVRLQLAVVQMKAVQELNQLKERLLQIIFSGQYDTAISYKTHIQNVRAVCDVFHSAIVSGTPVAMGTIQEKTEKARWLVGGHMEENDNEPSEWAQSSQDLESDFESQSEYLLNEEFSSEKASLSSHNTFSQSGSEIE